MDGDEDENKDDEKTSDGKHADSDSSSEFPYGLIIYVQRYLWKPDSPRIIALSTLILQRLYLSTSLFIWSFFLILRYSLSCLPLIAKQRSIAVDDRCAANNGKLS